MGLRVLMVRCRPGPAFIKLDKEEWVLEGPSVDDGLHQIHKGHDHEGDEKEGDEGPQMVPSHPNPVAQAADAVLLARVGGVTGGIWGRSALKGFVI